MSERGEDWRPTASKTVLRQRAAMLAQIREFFNSRDVLEVDTPLVINAPVTDQHIHSAKVLFSGSDTPFYLHTSPEYAMKRLLAAGSGDIFQICHVIRALEQGRIHNPEFTLLEWYRLGYSLEDLMTEVETLMRELLQKNLPSERLSYREAFLRELQLDPFSASDTELHHAARAAGLHATSLLTNRDAYLEFLMGTCVGPRLGHQTLCSVYHYPASQAALAALDSQDERCALRFELYCNGIELANGFKELTCAQQQQQRFARDQIQRQAAGLPELKIDQRFLAALRAGLPDCAGVAVGFDRVLMLRSGAAHIDAVLPFPTARA
jgi:elongation factor P--(R)-beta-lysine ligase